MRKGAGGRTITIGKDEEKRIADVLETNAYEISFVDLALEIGVPKTCIVRLLPEQGLEDARQLVLVVCRDLLPQLARLERAVGADRLLERPVEAVVVGVHVRRVWRLLQVHHHHIILLDRVLIEGVGDSFCAVRGGGAHFCLGCGQSACGIGVLLENTSWVSLLSHRTVTHPSDHQQNASGERLTCQIPIFLERTTAPVRLCRTSFMMAVSKWMCRMCRLDLTGGSRGGVAHPGGVSSGRLACTRTTSSC